MRTTFLTFLLLFLSFVQLNAQWFIQTTNKSERLYKTIFSDSINGFAIGENGIILKTTNGGNDWLTTISNTTNLLRSVFFPEISTGYTIGDNGTILKTSTSGLTWSILNSNTTNRIFSVYFTATNIGYVVGENGLILKTVDGGTNWNVQNINTLTSLYRVIFTDTNTGYCINRNQIYKTNNAGVTWNLNYQLDNQYFIYGISDIFFADPNNGYVIGASPETANSILLKTTNGGNNWIVNWVPGILGSSIFFNNANIGYAIAYKSIFKTIDGGTTWNLQFEEITNPLNDVFFTNLNNGWVVGENGTILHTDNGGLPTNQISFSEDSVYIPTIGDTGSVKIINTSEIPIKIDSIISVGSFYGYRGFLSKPGFEYQFYLFQTLPSPQWDDTLGIIIPPHDSINVSFYEVDLCPICDYEVQEYFKDTLRFVFTFMDGNIYSFSKSIPISGEGYPSDVEGEDVFLDEYILEQNYPNPFNPSTSIKYAISSRQFVALKVFDVLGNEIAVLVNEEKSSGSYEVNFSATGGASKLSSGVYYYQLRAGEYVESKKMIYLK
jgi:photosystem II stability/assembly factor-like uncharacterized protein